MAQPLNSSAGVRVAIVASIFLLCACRAEAPRNPQTNGTQSSPATAAPTPTAVATQATVEPTGTDTTALQVGKKPSPGTTSAPAGEAGPPPQNTTAATTTAPVAVTGTHLAPPP